MLKDDKLSFIYNAGNNIARFISVSPENKIRHVWIDENYISSTDLKENIINLINISSSKSVNIRSFSEESVKGNRFVYGKKLENIDEIMQIINENCVDGKYSIINETINGFEINEEGTYYATRYVLECIEEKFGECYNDEFIKTLSDTICDVSSHYDEYSQSVLESDFEAAINNVDSFEEIHFEYNGNDWKIRDLNSKMKDFSKDNVEYKELDM